MIILPNVSTVFNEQITMETLYTPVTYILYISIARR